jgi:DNA polymerase-3 subunit beta
LTCGSRIFTLYDATDAASFPSLPLLETTAPCALVNSDALSIGLEEVLFASLNENRDDRPVLSTVCLQVKEGLLHLVATNTCCLALRSIALLDEAEERESQMLIPARSLSLLAQVLPADSVVRIYKSPSSVLFCAENVRLASHLVLDTFPDYTKALPENACSIFTVKRADLLGLLQAFKPITRDSAHVLQVSYQSDALTFHADSSYLGAVSETVETSLSGEEGSLFLNACFLTDLCKSVDASAFTFLLQGRKQPVLVVPVGRSDYRFVAMPMNVRCY